MSRTPPEAGAPRLRRPWSRSERPVPRRVVRPLQEFLHREASSGFVLLAATVFALIWANVASGSYIDFWDTDVTVRVAGAEVTEDLRHVVNDGLMALFFFVIGLEVKRELVVGELADRRAAMTPLFAALGGMVVPAGVFLALTALDGGEGAEGWGIPMATDIAFALGVLAVLGRRVPAGLGIFLLAVAVIDDIGAILVIAVFYSSGIALAWLALALAALAAIVVLNRLGVRFMGVYVVVGAVVWFATFESGVHATIAGVAIGLLTPVRPFQSPRHVSREAYRIADLTADDPEDPDMDAAAWRRLSTLSRESISPLRRVEHALHPWTSFVVLPVFALANAGIVLDREAIDAAASSAVAVGVVAGLVLGKPIGIIAGALLCVRLGLGRLPAGLGRMHLLGGGALAGIGFTVSLFIATLAYEGGPLEDAAKMGILAGSVIAAVAGVVILLAARRRQLAPEP